MHRVHWEGPLPGIGGIVAIGGEQAAHALRVKRLRAGEAVELLDGVGGVALAVVEPPAAPRGHGRHDTDLLVRIQELRSVPALAPSVEVWAATPKGGRVDDLIEGLSEVGAAAWTPLRSARTIVEPRPSKLDRLARLAAESAKQCGRAWFLRVERERSFDHALAAPPGVLVVLADASGVPFRPPSPPPGGVRLVVGPEGGWTPGELDLARDSASLICRFGPHVMRIETAAVAGAAVIVDQLAGPAS